MDFEIAMLIAVFSPAIGLMAVIVSFLISISHGKHLNPVITFKEYPIEKVTLSHIYFNDRDGDSFNESYVILEDPNDEYQNVIIVETEYYETQWLFCRINITSSKYHVYLTNDVYERFKDGIVIYEDKNSK